MLTYWIYHAIIIGRSGKRPQAVFRFAPDWSDLFAGMAELADALDSGSNGRKAVQVQVLLPAPSSENGLFKPFSDVFFCRFFGLWSGVIQGWIGVFLPNFYHFSTTDLSSWFRHGFFLSIYSWHFISKLLSQSHFSVIEKMSVNIACHCYVGVSEPFLNVFKGESHIYEDAGAAVPLRYNYDKPEKPRISRVFGYQARFFILFQPEKSSREVVIS